MKEIYRYNKKQYWIFMFFVFGLAACNKGEWLDIKSDKNLTVPSSLQDFELLLDNFLVMNGQTPGLGEVGSDGHFISETRWSTLPDHPVGYSPRNAYTWTNLFPYKEVHDWNYSYQKIFQCNLVLEGLKKIKPLNSTEQELYNRTKGNALFHRAKNYFDLAQVYAQPYNPNTASSDLGIPLKEGIDITEQSARSTVQQTYDQIINDLNEASGLLPEVPQLVTRGSKAACYALLARAYLAMQDFSKAQVNADATINIYSDLMDFNDIPATATNLGLFNKETIFFSRMANWLLVYSSGYTYIDESLFDLYEEHDLRKTRFFRQTSLGIVFKGMYNSGTLQFSGLATDEMYLIRAECYARQNKVTEALDDLNHLLKTRWDKDVSYPTVTAIDAKEALDKILLERKKELLLRGIRWFDLKRLNLEEEHKTTLERIIGGQKYTLEPNSYKYALPIPDDVMRLAPGLKQNPGWGK